VLQIISINNDISKTNIEKLFYMQNFIWLAALVFSHCFGALAQTHSAETIVLETGLGTVKLKLFKETPLHRENFLKLARTGYFDSLMFHRVINGFMIQGGDPLSRRAKPGDSLGHGDAGYLVPAEFNRNIIHRKGRLCAARDNDDINPAQASSASQFYIVVGKIRTPEELNKIEERINKRRKSRPGQEKAPDYRFNEEEKSMYTTTAGTPHLDGSYTVFGEVIEGQDVVDRIAGVKTDSRDRPIEDIRMKITIINQ
jgi:cyclophilin family peptidyl-prolyl cis-trans isomerase